MTTSLYPLVFFVLGCGRRQGRDAKLDKGRKTPVFAEVTCTSIVAAGESSRDAGGTRTSP